MEDELGEKSWRIYGSLSLSPILSPVLHSTYSRSLSSFFSATMDGGKDYKKGLWTEEEDGMLMEYVRVHGKGRWNRVCEMTSLKRSGKSCRLRWMNYLSPHVKFGDFSKEEDDLIIRLHKLLGNRWSLIAGRVPGRTDNQVKNHWNTYLSKKRFSVTKDQRRSTRSRNRHEQNVQKPVRRSSNVPSESVSERIFNSAGESNGDGRIKSFGEETSRDDFESSNIWLSSDYIDLPTSYEMDPFSVASNVDFSMFFL